MDIKAKRNPIAKFTSIMIAVFIILMPVLSLAGTINLPRTGYDTCADTDGTLINCAGTGQDGDIQAGVEWPDPRFTDNGDDTMTDNLTGLVWTQDGRVAGNKTWQEALDYIAGMNAGTHPNFGHTDWRLPNILELFSLSNQGVNLSSNPTFTQWLNDQGFTDLSSTGAMYWSSTTLAGHETYTDKAYTFNTLSVHTWTVEKSGLVGLIWPVRAGQQDLPDPTYPANTRKTGQKTCYDTDGNVIDCTGTGQDGDLQWGVAWPNPRLTDNGDGTVTDNLTGLTLVQDVNALGEMTWHEALDYIAGMNAGTNQNFGRTDWRLVNINEAVSILDFEVTSGSMLPSGPSADFSLDFEGTSDSMLPDFHSTLFDYPFIFWTGTPFLKSDIALVVLTSPSIYGFLVDQLMNGENGKNRPVLASDIAGTVGPPLITTYANARANTQNSGWNGCPVSTYTGGLFNNYPPDLNPGGPMPLFFRRYYDSFIKSDGNITSSLGDNWLHNFDMILTLNGTSVKIINNEGRVINFQKNGASWDLTGKKDIAYQLMESGTDFILSNPYTEIMYTFDSTGKLTKIEDGKGNTHTLTYTVSNLTQVSDGLGRTLNFTYTGSLLSTVSDGTRTITFGHTGNDLTSVTDARGKATNFTYDTGGLMTATVRPEGNTHYSQTWDADKRVVTQTDALTNTHTFTYSSPDTTMTDPLGNTRKHTHSSTGELTGYQDADLQSCVIGYDSNSRRSSVTDRLGDTTTITYHTASGKLASVTNADGTITTYAYTLRTHSSGIKFYDLTAITYPDTTTESFVYDASGNMTSRTDRDSKVWTFTYNSRGQALTSANPSGGVTTFTYNTDGTMATSKDASNNTTTYAYDSFKRLITITRADATTRTFTYDNNDNVLTFTDERGNVTTFTYDDNNNLATMKDRLNKTTTFAYDGMDRVTSVTDPLGNASGSTYDELERLKTTTDRNGNTTTLGYDERGRLTSITDGEGKIWTRTYDAESIIASATDPLSHTTGFTSDKMGRITKTTSPLNNVTDVIYDSMGRIVSTEIPLSEITTYSYDNRGLLTGISIPESISTTYTRNALGLITAVTDPNTKVWKRAYDNQGRITSRTDPLSNETSYEYDSRNRVSRVNLPASTLDLTYDNTSNVTRRLYSDATDLNYTYDKEGRLTGANGLTLAYDDNGRITNSNGLSIARDKGGRIANIASAIIYTYDSRDLLTSVTDWLGGTTSFTYDDAGRLTTITRPNGVNTIYTYDNDDRLISIQEGSLSTISLTRDAKGQITNASRTLPLEPVLTASTTTLTYDAASQVSAYTYDGMGRLTNDGKRTYIWDLASRLMSYTEGGNTVSFTYDAMGNRTSRTEGGVTRSYIWNYALGIPSITAEMQGGSFLRFYIHTPGGQLLYSIDAATNARGFYHYDEMGNTLFITDNTGAVIAGYAYSPYGEVLASAGTVSNTFTWQGQNGIMQEKDSGLYYIRARYYDSNGARFISQDPVKSISPKSLNPYQYAWGNPLRYSDTSGRAPGDATQGPQVPTSELGSAATSGLSLGLRSTGAALTAGGAGLLGDSINLGIHLSADEIDAGAVAEDAALITVDASSMYLTGAAATAETGAITGASFAGPAVFVYAIGRLGIVGWEAWLDLQDVLDRIEVQQQVNEIHTRWQARQHAESLARMEEERRLIHERYEQRQQQLRDDQVAYDDAQLSEAEQRRQALKFLADLLAY